MEIIPISLKFIEKRLYNYWFDSIVSIWYVCICIWVCLCVFRFTCVYVHVYIYKLDYRNHTKILLPAITGW